MNPNLVAHFAGVAPPAPARVFVPLSGKTRDIAWLLGQGYQVVGAELSKLAIKDLFDGLGIIPQITGHGTGQHFAGPGIDIFVNDIFELTPADIGKVDVVYDRAALVALSQDLRGPYAALVAMLSRAAPQLLLCLEYDQSAMNGPPFAVDYTDIKCVYGLVYDIKAVERKAISGRLVTRLHTSKIADHTAWALNALRR